jgi:hypothetical protein
VQQQHKEFEQEMFDKKAAWKKEQEDAEQERRERGVFVKKERTREEEEYRYNTLLERKKEEDLYEAKQAALEKALEEKKTKVLQDLAEREKMVTLQEAELKSLRERVERFPQELETAVKSTEHDVREELDRTYRYQTEIAARETEGERKLNMQMITTLQAKIKEQEMLVRSLSQKTDEAGNQVQTIALKALESSSYMRYHPAADDAKKANQTTGG